MKKNERPLAVIAGTGVFDQFEVLNPRRVKTPYGSPVAFESAKGGFFILPRHGRLHDVPPHRINYRANIAALARLGVKDVIATSAVGSMEREFGVGGIGVVEQFLDFTKRREGTFFDDKVTHTDVTYPYSRSINNRILRAASRLGIKVRSGMTYVCVEGPRFETAAEITMFRKMGGDVVGMTGVPEVVLANEMGINYASIVTATNWAAGIQRRVSHHGVLKVMRRSGRIVKELIEATIKDIG